MHGLNITCLDVANSRNLGVSNGRVRTAGRIHVRMFILSGEWGNMALRFSVPVFAFCNRFKYVVAISRQLVQLLLLDPFRHAVALANWASRGVVGKRCLPWDLVQELFHAQLKSEC